VFVDQTETSRARWDLCMGVAAQHFAEDGSDGEVRMAARVLFDSDIPTFDPAG
jgi:hypothetical protein